MADAVAMLLSRVWCPRLRAILSAAGIRRIIQESTRGDPRIGGWIGRRGERGDQQRTTHTPWTQRRSQELTIEN